MNKRMGGMVCLRPQRKGFPTGGWVERGRRYAMPPIQVDTHSFFIIDIHYCDEPVWMKMRYATPEKDSKEGVQ